MPDWGIWFAQAQLFVDRFHSTSLYMLTPHVLMFLLHAVRNHTDAWCKENMDAHNIADPAVAEANSQASGTPRASKS